MRAQNSQNTRRAAGTAQGTSKMPTGEPVQPTGTSEHVPRAPVRQQGLQKHQTRRLYSVKTSETTRRTHATTDKDLQNARLRTVLTARTPKTAGGRQFA